ncbi:hypothetical protein M1N13_03955 [Dehalococcoidia bacterium]|nr:hypothetical protein [Dehalococcoidia bacterium]
MSRKAIIAESESNSVPSYGEDGRLARKWIVIGTLAGLLGAAAYFIGITAFVPGWLSLLFVFAFGPLLSLGFIGIYFFFGLHKKSVALQASVVFGVIAGTINNMMLVFYRALYLTIPTEARPGLGLSWEGVHMVQEGLEMSWDIYLSVASILLGIAMLSHPRFGKIWGGITMALFAAHVAVRLWAFPIGPAGGLIYLGPVSAVWYVVILIRVLSSLKWVDQRLTAARVPGRRAA